MFNKNISFINNKIKNIINYEHFAMELTIIHIFSFISFFMINKIKYKTILLQFFIFIFSEISITGGYHRLWSHRSYKAHPILEWFYLIFGTIASQSDVLKWTKDHRTHHRKEEVDGDPYNINKGFWHAHIWWLFEDYDLITKNEVKKTDIKDLLDNKKLVFQKKYYSLLWFLFAIFYPTLICSFWDDAYNGFLSNFIRIIFNLHITYSVNSMAHYIGSKPFKNNIKASENFFISLITFGEGWHNYHHSFPKDYRASEINKYNPTTYFIDFTKRLGLSYNHYFKKNKIINKDRFDLINYEKYKFN